ncbi:hypothetical protein BJV77DRAFT_533059 [Russula vinacea]|nr:hypothetical protein BJV77DRAFT_533059 [Russula vinacea]
METHLVSSEAPVRPTNSHSPSPFLSFLPMADSPPPSNSSRLSTPTLLPLPGLHQLPEVEPELEPEPEPEREARLTIAIDAPPPSPGEPDENKSKNEDKKISPESAETTGSQLTSSDKLSALPSRIRSPPAGRSATAATGSRPNKVIVAARRAPIRTSSFDDDYAGSALCTAVYPVAQRLADLPQLV